MLSSCGLREIAADSTYKQTHIYHTYVTSKHMVYHKESKSWTKFCSPASHKKEGKHLLAKKYKNSYMLIVLPFSTLHEMLVSYGNNIVMAELPGLTVRWGTGPPSWRMTGPVVLQLSSTTAIGEVFRPSWTFIPCTYTMFLTKHLSWA